MPQSVRLTAALSIALLTLLAGCSLKSNSPRSSANSAESATESENPVALAKKPAIPSLASPDNPDPAIQQQVEQYFNGFAAKGFASKAKACGYKRVILF
jgi:D-alanyl-D-alanine carboxypeptidase/D-alanyl-D-alanine-endopeptidase (penicillin-binding protein 4)